jgi:DNA modification methylase
MSNAEVRVGDCRDVMRSLPPDSVDSIVTDPPYGLAFMGKEWDHGVPGVEFWAEALRVAKPGAHLVAFGGTRTFHRLAVAIEDAGWEVRDCLSWLYGSGFPKSLDISKAIDKAAGAEREVVGTKRGTAADPSTGRKDMPGKATGVKQIGIDVLITVPATDAAKQWDGWGTALKPAWEPIVLARKPLVGTVAANVTQYGTGGINVDGCRIGTDDNLNGGAYATEKHRVGGIYGNLNYAAGTYKQPSGRWPANVCLDEDAAALFPESRFFYTAKASRREREAGLDGMPRKDKPGAFDDDAYEWKQGGGHVKASPAANHHPTVKPIALMRWLCRLVTPPNGLVLDPFNGSGSTGCAAVLEGFRYLGAELDAEYVEIARKRIAHWDGQRDMREGA